MSEGDVPEINPQHAVESEQPPQPPVAEDVLAVLRAGGSVGDGAKVLSFSAEPAGGTGANFLGDLWRVRIALAGKTEPQSLILKRIPNDEQKMEFLRASGLFEVETAAYLHVLPRMADSLVRSHGSCSLWPRLFGVSADHSQLVMEDLCASGFSLGDKRRGLSLAQSRSVMRTMGRLHAASVDLHLRHPESMKPFGESLFREQTRMFLETYLCGAARQLAMQMRQWPDLQHLADRVDGLQETFWDLVTAAVRSSATGFNVLNHGDLWVNNILFHPRTTVEGKGEEEESEPEAALVDWQNAVWTSPALDLLYFLYTSPCDKVRQEYKADLIEEYHRELVNTLTKLGQTVHSPSLSALREDLERRFAIALFPVVAELPNMLAPAEMFYDLGLYFEEEPPRNTTYALPEYATVAHRLLPELAKKGLI